MDCHISVEVDLIFEITGIPIEGVNPMPLFVGKEHDSGLVDQMKEKYNLARDRKGFSISSINDTRVQFVTIVLSNKLFRNM